MTPEERLTALERMLTKVVASGTPDFAGLDERDARALASVDSRRLLVYRKLVRGTMRDAIRNQIPRTAERLEEFDGWVARFCETELPRSQVLRDVAFEFCAWAAPAWQRDDRLPPYLSDLARYELLEFDVLIARRVPCETRDELSADRGVAFDGSVRVARFSHSVHRSDREPEPGEHRLFAYRDRNGELVRLELTRAATTLVMLLLLQGEALGQALRRTCEVHGEPLDSPLIDATAQLLADLSDRGALLGSCEPGPREPPSPFFAWLAGVADRSATF